MALASTLWIQAVVSWAMLTVPVFAPTAAGDLGLPASAIGYYASLVYIGAMAGALFGGGFVPRFGAMRVSQAGLVGCAVGLAAVVPGLWLPIALGALALGLGYGPATPASSHVLARHTPARLRSLVFSIKQTGVPLGGALAGATVPPLVLWLGWQGAAVAVALCCLGTAALVQPTRPLLDVDRNRGEPWLRGNPFQPLRFVMSRPDLRVLALTSLVFSAIQQCLGVFLVTYLTAEAGLSLVGAGLVLSVSQGAGIAGRILWGAVADRMDRHAAGRSRLLLGLLALGMVVSCAAMGLVTRDWPMAALAGVAAAYGLTGVGWNGVLLADVARLAGPEEASRATGGTLFVTFFGVVIAPPILGELARLTGSFAIMYLALAALALPCAWVFLRRGRRG
ncbi:MAG: MFS transporter [Rhodospirillales bacterium]